MTKQKWSAEKHAWADGVEVEQRNLNSQYDKNWDTFEGRWFESSGWEYRVKPEPKPDLLTYCEIRRSGFFYGLYSTESENASVCAILDGETKKLKSVRMIGKPDPERMEALLRIWVEDDISLDTRAEIKEALRTD